MRHSLLTLLVMIAGVNLVLTAQNTTGKTAISVTRPVMISENGNRPLFAPNGAYVVLHDAGQPGLSLIDMANMERREIVSGVDVDNDVRISRGGSSIVWRETQYKDHLAYRSIESINLSTRTRKQVDALSREKYPFQFAGGKVKVAKRTSMRSLRLVTDTKPVTHEYVLSAEEDDLVLYDGNQRRVLNPNGAASYIWESLSPDEQHIVYMAIGDKCHTYVCDIDGSNVVDLGYIGSPSWFGNNMIIGMEDEDDGHQMTSSKLIAIRRDGTNRQVLATPGCKFPINPTASIEAGKVAFENEGKVYVVEIENFEF